MKRLLVPAFLVLLVPVGPAQAQDDDGAQGAATPSQPRMSLASTTGIKDGKDRFVLARQDVVVKGVVRPYVSGQRVLVKVDRGGKRVEREEVALERRRDGSGEFELSFRAAKTGKHTITAEHVATPELAAVSTRYKVHAIKTPRAGGGARGQRVRLLQTALTDQGYAVGRSGRFDRNTAYAVAALRNVNRLGREGYASKRVYELLFRNRAAFKLRSPQAWRQGTKGKHVEFDKSRQVIVLARYGKPERVVYTSSGTSSTPTIYGRYRFYRKSPGTNSKGMVHSSYFIRGYAIHGYKSVPTYPASHGCLRVPIPLARGVFNWVDVGDPIHSYQ